MVFLSEMLTDQDLNDLFGKEKIHNFNVNIVVELSNLPNDNFTTQI